jgi:hypothetical protein
VEEAAGPIIAFVGNFTLHALTPINKYRGECILIP